MSGTRWTRRAILALSGLGFGATQAPTHEPHGRMGLVGRVTDASIDPTAFLRTWNFSDLPAPERAKYYRETRRPDGTMLREYQIYAAPKTIEVAPGVKFEAWTYNGQVPGPTLRATVGDEIRVTFENRSAHPHSIHFHGWHAADMDGSLPSQAIAPGATFTYAFRADPAGVHFYNCHVEPFKRHIHKGLYGAFIVDPREARPAADELVMVMNAFDTNTDGKNEFYAVNTVAHHFMHDPVRVRVGRPVRIFLINVTEFDPINSFHLHGHFFDVYRTGTLPQPDAHADTLMLCQGERARLEVTFRSPGDYMFHAHQSEFAELGWMGLFRAEPA
ncbi:MAG TPA: multicopper oxidase domain-containing protein [Vicinamibacterales bacterium]|nr:multicopper oxidase domain-containing protein [Vicinamibacterales bacterium]